MAEIDHEIKVRQVTISSTLCCILLSHSLAVYISYLPSFPSTLVHFFSVFTFLFYMQVMGCGISNVEGFDNDGPAYYPITNTTAPSPSYVASQSSIFQQLSQGKKRQAAKNI
jgi:hypothetical protein